MCSRLYCTRMWTAHKNWHFTVPQFLCDLELKVIILRLNIQNAFFFKGFSNLVVRRILSHGTKRLGYRHAFFFIGSFCIEFHTSYDYIIYCVRIGTWITSRHKAQKGPLTYCHCDLFVLWIILIWASLLYLAWVYELLTMPPHPGWSPNLS